MEKFNDEIAEKVRAWFEGAEVKAAIEATEKAVDSETGTFEVVITTENLDRYQEVISLDGWELEHYRANPVVLWGHDHFTLPIGVCTSLEKVEGKLIAKGKFSPHAHAQDIRRLYDLGIVRATSVGFISKEQEGNLITKAELLEFSFVSVPANPYALSLAMKGGQNINELVTRGIFTIKEVEEETVPEKNEPETPETEPIADDQPTDEPVVAEKTFLTKTITPIVDQLKGVVSALEALDLGEPERAEDEPEADQTEEEKALAEFSTKRRALQDAATIIGEVLAEARQAVEARR